MRQFLAVLAALMLVSCDDKPVFGGSASATPAAVLPASCTDPAAVVVLRTTQTQPDWLLFAHQAGGGDIHFNQRSIRRCGDNEAEIVVQVRYVEPQLYAIEHADRSQTTVRYTVERVRYHYRCTPATFAIVDRQVVDDSDRVVATIPGRADLYRPATPASPAGLIIRTACLGH